MVPTLQPGDRLVVWRTKRFRPGDIVAAADPRQPTRTVLKRAATVGSEWIFLVGDNEVRSTDSRHFGPVALGLVRGKAVYRYAPQARAGRLQPRRGNRAGAGDR
jgi:nickel-type superoxide dismutase maturation protease